MTPITKAEIEELDALEKKAVASWNVENGRGEKFKCTTMDTVIFQEALVKIWPRIKALAQSARVTEGMVVVPKEPTPEMITAAVRNDPLSCDVPKEDFAMIYGEIYRAMLAAAHGEKDEA